MNGQMDLLCGYPKDIDRPGHEKMKPMVGMNVLCVVNKKFEESLNGEPRLLLMGQIVKIIKK